MNFELFPREFGRSADEGGGANYSGGVRLRRRPRPPEAGGLSEGLLSWKQQQHC